MSASNAASSFIASDEPTIADVARAAGVAPGTGADGAAGGDELGRVSGAVALHDVVDALVDRALQHDEALLGRELVVERDDLEAAVASVAMAIVLWRGQTPPVPARLAASSSRSGSKAGVVEPVLA